MEIYCNDISGVWTVNLAGCIFLLGGFGSGVVDCGPPLFLEVTLLVSGDCLATTGNLTITVATVP
jgi:hypothetical protein